MTPYAPTPPVAPDDPEYVAAAREEAAYWANPAMISIADAIALAPAGIMTRHLNQRFTGDPRTPWYDSIVRHGPFRRGLLLGCGGMAQERRILETNPGLHLLVMDIDDAGLERREREFGACFPGHITTRRADLNFTELDADAFDLVVSADTLHHIVNLEHVAGQINRALAPGGQFFLYDYTGPSGFRFPATQRRMFELLYERERRRSASELPGIEWSDVDAGNNSPFEAVRSADTLGVLASALAEVERRGAGAISALLLFAGLADRLNRLTPRREPRGISRLSSRLRPSGLRGPRLIWERMLSEEFRRELTFVDGVVCDAGVFPPNNTFAHYRKR